MSVQEGMKDGQTGSYAGTPASMTLMEKDKDEEHSPPSSTYSTKEKRVPGKVSPQSCVSQKVSKNVSNNVPKSTKSPKNSLKAVPKFTNGHNGAPECGRCHSDQFVREGLSCYLCNEMFHACCREPGAGSTSSTAICPKSWYTAVATLTRKENSDTHNGRWGHFMFMCNKCQNKVSDLKRKGNCSDKITKMVNVACDSGVTFGEKATNTDGLSELTNFPLTFGNSESLNESPDNTCSSEKSLEKILESFKDQVLESVENLMSQKLDSHNNFRSRTPRPSSDSSTPSFSSYAGSSKTYLGAFQSTPVPSQPRNCLPSASVSSIDLAVKSIRNDVEKSSISQDHVVVLRSNDDSVNVIDEKKRVTDALKAVPISDLRENKKSNKIVLHFPSEQAKVNAKTTLEKTLEGCKISVDEGKKMFPKITITNIPNYLVSHITSDKSSTAQFRENVGVFVKEKFLEKNEVLRQMVVTDEKTFEVIYVKSGYNFTTVGVKVSPVIRKYLIEQGYIYIGETRCKVMDRIDLKQCFKCQKIGHIASQCRGKTICMYCGGSHPTAECRSKGDRNKYRCVNCSHSDIEDHRAKCDTHHSSDIDCPILQLEKLRLQNRTEYQKNI